MFGDKFPNTPLLGVKFLGNPQIFGNDGQGREIIFI